MYSTTDQLTDKIIADNTVSQVESEGCHYQVLTEKIYHKRDDSVITNINGFI